MTRAPIRFVYRNLVFGAGRDDVWGLYRLPTRSYPGLTATGKMEVLAQFAAFASTVEADFQLLRVSRAWSGEDYVAQAQELAHPGGDGRRLDALLATHDSILAEGVPARAEVFLAVRLARASGALLSRDGGLADRLAALLGVRDPRGLTQRRLEQVLDAEQGAFARVCDFLVCERASTREVQWLIRRTLTRGSSEPWLDRFWQPQALVLDSEDEHGGRRLQPLEADVLRLLDVPVEQRARSLVIAGEDGESHQAQLVLGALPELTRFPGRLAELLFAPLEALAFPVDACFWTRFIPNDRALALTRRRIVDADHAFHEEAHGEHGPTAQTSARPDLARELEEVLTASDRPPLLRAQIGLAVGAPSAQELEERVALVRREYQPISLHRPLGEQHRLWMAHLPGQLSPVACYDDLLLTEQFGAMVPTATHAVGTTAGLYIGHSLSGSRQPVLFDATEASRTARPPAVVCAGAPGSGKTVAAQLLAYHAYLLGSRVIDIDPKGDHHLDALIGPDQVERIDLGAEQEHRGLLDPLRVAPQELRGDLAFSFLVDLLPTPVSAGWQTEIRAAVSKAVAADERSCEHVLRRLDLLGPDGTAAARAIRVHAESGLLRLGFADPDQPPPPLDERPVTSLRIQHLTLPAPGTPRAELTSEERTGRALLRLLAAAALHLIGQDWTRHKILLLDEAWTLLGDSAGLALLQRINRLCRALNATPILATQVIGDLQGLEELTGCLLAFGVQTDSEARRVLTLLGLDPEDQDTRSQLLAFRRGRCLMRDYDGRVGPVQIDAGDPALLAALDTTPNRHRAHGNGRLPDPGTIPG